MPFFYNEYRTSKKSLQRTELQHDWQLLQSPNQFIHFQRAIVLKLSSVTYWWHLRGNWMPRKFCSWSNRMHFWETFLCLIALYYINLHYITQIKGATVRQNNLFTSHNMKKKNMKKITITSEYWVMLVSQSTYQDYCNNNC